MLETTTLIAATEQETLDELHCVDGQQVHVCVSVDSNGEDGSWVVQMIAGSSVRCVVRGPIEDATARGQQLFSRFFPDHECTEKCGQTYAIDRGLHRTQ